MKKNLKALIGLDPIKSHQVGGSIESKKKEELFPFFAYLYSKQLDPEKYGATQSMEEWTALIQQNEEDVNTIAKAASELTEEDWNSLAVKYEEAQNGAQMQLAAKGAKLQKLKSGEKETPKTKPVTKGKAGMKAKKRKCSCGCDLVISKAAGGKLTESCACKCGGKLKKKK